MLRGLRCALPLLVLLTGCIGIPVHAKTKNKPLPKELNRLPHERVEIPAPDQEGVVLRGIWVEGNGPPVLVLSGSNMGISGVAEFIEILYNAGYSVLCCDYRGTGWSSGRWWRNKSCKLDDDARAQWEWLRENKGEPVGVVGISIGAIAASGLLTLEHPPQAVVLDRPVNPKTVVRRFMRNGLGPISAAISRVVVRARADVDMKAQITNAKTDTLALLPEADFLMPKRDVDDWLEHKSDRVEVFVAPGGHLSSHLVEPMAWRTALLDFLDARLRPGLPKKGRAMPPDPARVEKVTVESRVIDITLDRDTDALPEKITLLVMARARNILVYVEKPARRMRWKISRKSASRLSGLIGARVVPEGFRHTSGTTTMFGDKEDPKMRDRERAGRLPIDG